MFYTRQYQSAAPYASECILYPLDSILRMKVMQLHDSKISNFFGFSIHICMYNAMHETPNHRRKHDQILGTSPKLKSHRESLCVIKRKGDTEIWEKKMVSTMKGWSGTSNGDWGVIMGV